KDVSANLSRRLKSVLMDQQNDALDQLRRWTQSGSAPAPEELLTQIRPAVQRAAVASLQGAYGAGQEILDGDPSDETDVSQEAAALAAELVDPLLSRVERTLYDGVDGAEGRIRAIFREWRSERINPAVEAGVLGVIGRGMTDALDDGDLVRWVCPEGHECVEGAENELAGALRLGETFPSGHSLAPAYAGCRCLVVPADR
ncbi:MAG: hypothetical protein ACC652_04025, partial [Acidimicrobiales bacterium]